MTRKIAFGLALGSLLTMLSACGCDPGTRAVTGGLLGAGTGAGVAAVTGGRPATGALIGGGVGAVGGAVTSPRISGYGSLKCGGHVAARLLRRPVVLIPSRTQGLAGC